MSNINRDLNKVTPAPNCRRVKRRPEKQIAAIVMKNRYSDTMTRSALEYGVINPNDERMSIRLTR